MIKKLYRLFTKEVYYSAFIHKGYVDMVEAFLKEGIDNIRTVKYNPIVVFPEIQKLKDIMAHSNTKDCPQKYYMTKHHTYWDEFRYIEPENLIKIMVNQIANKFKKQDIIPIVAESEYHSYKIQIIEGYIEPRFLLKKILKPIQFSTCYRYIFNTIIGVKK